MRARTAENVILREAEEPALEETRIATREATRRAVDARRRRAVDQARARVEELRATQWMWEQRVADLTGSPALREELALARTALLAAGVDVRRALARLYDLEQFGDR